MPVVVLAIVSLAHAQTTVNRKYKETLLGPFPKEAQATAVLSADGMRAAWTENGNMVVVDGKPQKTYAKVAGIVFSGDGKWLAYAASDGTKWFVVVGDRQEPPFPRVGPPIFSGDSKRLAYVALQDDGSRVVVVNRTPGLAWDEIFEGRVVFSPEGDHTAYGARKGQQWHVVVDGQPGPAADFLGAATGIQFSADGGRVGYAAMQGNRWHLVVNGIDQPAYENVGDLTLHPDEDRFAYAALREGKWHVVVDRKEQKPYEAIGEGTLRYSRSGRHLAYAAQQGGRWLVVADGQEGKPYDAVAQLAFSNNGQRLVYTVKSGVAQMVVEVAFGEKGDQRIRDHRVLDRVGPNTVVFSPNSQRLGYIGRSGKATFVVVDGKRKPRYDMAGYLTFSPDNAHYVYAATRDDKAFTVVDEAEAAHHYDAIWTPPDSRLVFDTRKRFHYLAMKEGKLFLVEEETE